MKVVVAALILVFSRSGIADPVNSDGLDALLSEVKQGRLNRLKAELPEGIHWMEGYFNAGLFYPCSKSSGLFLIDNEFKQKLNKYTKAVHVEFTATISGGSIAIMEIHNVSTDYPDSCALERLQSGT